MTPLRFKQFERALCASGVATRHSRRAAAEINAHHAQQFEAARAAGKSDADALAEADALIGDEQVLVERYASRPELRAFSHRRPLLAFGVLPVLGVLLLLAGGLFAALVIVPPAIHFEIPGAGVLYTAMTIKVVTLWILPVVLSAWCARLAWLHRIALGWPIVTALLVCALGMMVQLNATYDTTTPKPSGTLQFGLGFPPPTDQAVRGLITFGITLIPLVMLGREVFARRRNLAGD